MNPNEPPINVQDKAQICFNCGSSAVGKSWKEQTFQYGNGESATELVATVPVFTCESCGFQFAGSEAEDIRHEVVCRHLGLLTPAEISAIRENTKLGRAQFAECIGFGIASLKRWESGALIQNAANDSLIYLMAFPDNLERLQHRDHKKALDLVTLSADPATSYRRHHLRFRGRGLRVDETIARRAQQFRLRTIIE
jgi:DNA-binding transcriptional regulator YiaG